MTANAEEALQYLISNGKVSVELVKWGKGTRTVVIINSKKYQYKQDSVINNNFKNIIMPLYIEMASASSPTKAYKNEIIQKLKRLMMEILMDLI